MNHPTIEVQVLDKDTMKMLEKVRIPQATIPSKGSQFHTNISYNGIFKNTKYEVCDVIYKYTQKNDSDCYGKYSVDLMSIQLLVAKISFETNQTISPKKTKY